ncbi:MAG TPA: hypothetical protein VL091_07430 [Marinobacter sp.]|nr:hypothetical protein [Marinobacter sp.]
MSETRISENVSRLCLTLALVLMFLAWGAAGVNAPALDQQIDGPGSSQTALLNSFGDSPSTELGPPNTVFPVILLVAGHLVFSSNLRFVQPPARLLSFPSWPQGPPSLV